MLKGEPRGVAKGDTAGRVGAPALRGEKRCQRPSGRLVGIFTKTASQGPVLNVLGSLADGLGPVETPKPGDTARQPLGSTC